MCSEALATWRNLPYANLPPLIEKASFVWCNISWHEVARALRVETIPVRRTQDLFSSLTTPGRLRLFINISKKQQENNLIYSTESEYKFVFNIILIATPILSSFIVGLFLRILFAFISFEWKIPLGKRFINQQLPLKFPQIAFLLKFFCNLEFWK